MAASVDWNWDFRYSINTTTTSQSATNHIFTLPIVIKRRHWPITNQQNLQTMTWIVELKWDQTGCTVHLHNINRL